MWLEIKSRLRSPVVWVSFVAVLVLFMNAYNLWRFIGMDVNQFKEIIDALMTALIAFGVLNNPTEKEKF